MGKWAIMMGVCVILAAGLTCLDRASATTVKPYTMRAMTVNADDIVRGTVVDQEGVYDADRGYVYTHTVIRVTETLAAPSSETSWSSDSLAAKQRGDSCRWSGQRPAAGRRCRGVLPDRRRLPYLIGMAQGNTPSRWERTAWMSEDTQSTDAASAYPVRSTRPRAP